MDDEPLVFKATYHNIRNVAGRGVMQIVLEVDHRDSNWALQCLGGLPNSDEARWFAVTRLEE